MFRALISDDITLHLIEEDNLADIAGLFQGYPDSREMLEELFRNYLPQYDRAGRRTTFGFYSYLGAELAGMTLLSVDSWDEKAGSTGADVFRHMRGRGVTPRSKPHLFYLAFELLGLNRVATGCRVSNLSSKRSIEKTAGFQFEGVMRESGVNDQGEFEDELLYAILRRDWQGLYHPAAVTVVQ
ncbi:RimJ/RimL family protein N-acetyltransferase [Hymenobacter luteus]|uniref:RimJ/RimL family protein N-acetyltransferase n=2 Tax=Hymenobacter TaxID=89966 RepID=A0A7W9SXS7_9BACT|nr:MULTISPECIES: GNAT family protein [Hymenobacter]MBB4599808.1 RimJ/RimL family protein N-acetyltransferase [Hymenobacter latericoloratus]MBB6057882.1 RimJ/RimL family protein N-acetyltransferase [Hymenobacter luteus]